MKVPVASEIRSVLDLLNAGQDDKAVSVAKRLIAKFPEDPPLHMLLGVGFAQQGKLDPAINSYKKALALRPHYIDALNNLAVAYRKKGDLALAEKAYRDACKIQPGNADVLYNLGGLREAQGFADDAVEIYCKVLSLAPDHFEALNNLGAIYHREGRAAEAVAFFSKAHALRPNDIGVLRNLGLLLEATGKFEDLRDIDLKILALDPEHMNRLGTSACEEKNAGRPVAARLERILNCTPKQWSDVSTAMWAALAAGLPEKAFSYQSSKLNILPYAEMSGMYRSASLAEVRGRLPDVRGVWPEPGQGPVIFAAASGDYAEIFARDLIESVLSKSADTAFHLHIMNPGSYDVAQVFPDGRVTVTYEEIGPCEKTLYTTRRFVRLSQFIAHANRDFIAVDVDSLFNGDISAFHETLGSYDAAIYLRDSEPFVNQMIYAGALAISPTSEGRAFIDFISSYVLHFENIGTSKWFVDQMAIISAYTWFKEHVPHAVFKFLPQAAIDWSDRYDPASLIWTQKGRDKLKFSEV